MSAMTLGEAVEAGRRGEIASWLQSFLRGSGGNAAFADGLLLRDRWYVGPAEFPLAELERICGPEPGMEYAVPADVFESYVGAMVDSLAHGWAPPPLVCDGETMKLRDGSHRHEALRRRGVKRWWTVFYFSSAQARDRFLAQRAGAPRSQEPPAAGP